MKIDMKMAVCSTSLHSKHLASMVQYVYRIKHFAPDPAIFSPGSEIVMYFVYVVSKFMVKYKDLLAKQNSKIFSFQKIFMDISHHRYLLCRDNN